MLPLDAMTTEELYKFHAEVKTHPIKFARENFAGKYKAVAAARDLANYALNRARMLEATNEDVRQRYSAICANIRVKFLPDYALVFVYKLESN